MSTPLAELFKVEKQHLLWQLQQGKIFISFVEQEISEDRDPTESQGKSYDSPQKMFSL